MPTAKAIRKRIASVKNTQKITKAMKMVAAAKLRRAQRRLMEARPYTAEAKQLIARIAARTGSSAHPLFTEREAPRKLELFVLTADKGLCGGFNGNLLRRVEEFLARERLRYQDIRITALGKKGRDYLRAKKIDVAKAEVGFLEGFGVAAAETLATDLLRGFEEQEFDELVIVSNRFKSMISQEVTFERLIPIAIVPDPLAPPAVDYLFEPSRGEIVAAAARTYLKARLYSAALESAAAELSARMVAMENATKNSTDMIYRLTLAMNKARQAAITKELMDIVNGAEAIKG